MTSQKFLFQNGTSHRDSIFTHFFMPENILPGTDLYLTLHFHGFEAKQNIRMFTFSRRLISKTIAATPR